MVGSRGAEDGARKRCSRAPRGDRPHANRGDRAVRCKLKREGVNWRRGRRDRPGRCRAFQVVAVTRVHCCCDGVQDVLRKRVGIARKETEKVLSEYDSKLLACDEEIQHIAVRGFAALTARPFRPLARACVVACWRVLTCPRAVRLLWLSGPAQVRGRGIEAPR